MAKRTSSKSGRSTGAADSPRARKRRSKARSAEATAERRRSKPKSASASASEPSASKPSASKPSASKPSASKPRSSTKTTRSSKPSDSTKTSRSSKPSASKPSASKPSASKPESTREATAEARERRRRRRSRTEASAAASAEDKPTRRSSERSAEGERGASTQRRRTTRSQASAEAGSAERKARRRRSQSRILDEGAPTAGALSRADARRSGSATRFRTRVLRERVDDRSAEQQRQQEQDERERAHKEAIAQQLSAGDFEYSGRSGAEAATRSPIVIGGLVAGSAVIFALVLVMLMKEEPPPKRLPPPQPIAQVTPPPEEPQAPIAVDPLPMTPTDTGPKVPDDIVLVDDGPMPQGALSEELLARSAFHTSVADMLAEFERIRSDRGQGQHPFEDYRERQRLENELLEQLKMLGDEGVPAMVEVLKTISGHPFQLFLARALASMEGPEAQKATGMLLKEYEDYGVRMQIIKSLPRTEHSISVLAQTLPQVQDSNLRVMLLREFAHRTREDDPSAEESAALFRYLALKDENPTVRAEAIAVIGRRRLQGEREILERIAREETHATVRQRAIVSLARTSGEDSLPTLRTVLEDQKADEAVRASAVLALTLIGPRALPLLEDVVRRDGSTEIRDRAQRAILSIRNQEAHRQQPPSGPAYPDAPPFTPGR